MTDPAPSAVPAAAQSEETVNVTLFDTALMMAPGVGGYGMPPVTMSASADRNVVKAGPVKINVVNQSHAMAHDLVVTTVDSEETWLPPDFMLWVRLSDKNPRTGPLKPGQSKTLALTLPAGNYVLASSVGRDFTSGMVTRLKVTQ